MADYERGSKHKVDLNAHKIISGEAKENMQQSTGKFFEVVGTIVKTPFDFVAWLYNNWQLAIIGVVALLVLLRD